ncbi:hypothetical protein [Microbacterium sp. H6]|uniref:hypothetical protein n=1 Tax=Microbacterium sp. H6 TaxID=421122 RepID=UPI000DE43C2F|nr:hypothetical protein [Microbacterium sp. H6]RBO73506.1 hypothetical protein DSP71_04945 [Microbacterium sp. H6]
MGERNQHNRWRCTVVGCNPKIIGQAAADEHAATGHRVAKWPIRSPLGKAKARERNRTGYYDQYNVGEKSAEARGIGQRHRGDGFVLTGDDFSIDNAGPFGG